MTSLAPGAALRMVARTRSRIFRTSLGNVDMYSSTGVGIFVEVYIDAPLINPGGHVAAGRALLVAQRQDRVDPARPPGGDETGGGRHRREQHHHGPRDRGIARLDPVQLRR